MIFSHQDSTCSLRASAIAAPPRPGPTLRVELHSTDTCFQMLPAPESDPPNYLTNFRLAAVMEDPAKAKAGHENLNQVSHHML